MGLGLQFGFIFNEMFFGGRGLKTPNKICLIWHLRREKLQEIPHRQQRWISSEIRSDVYFQKDLNSEQNILYLINRNFLQQQNH